MIHKKYLKQVTSESKMRDDDEKEEVAAAAAAKRCTTDCCMIGSRQYIKGAQPTA